MNVGVVVFPGSNCDRDMFHVLSDVFNLNAQYCWHDKPLPDNLDAVILPGGFSYGDVLGAGGGWAKNILFTDVLRYGIGYILMQFSQDIWPFIICSSYTQMLNLTFGNFRIRTKLWVV